MESNFVNSPQMKHDPFVNSPQMKHDPFGTSSTDLRLENPDSMDMDIQRPDNSDNSDSLDDSVTSNGDNLTRSSSGDSSSSSLYDFPSSFADSWAFLKYFHNLTGIDVGPFDTFGLAFGMYLKDQYPNWNSSSGIIDMLKWSCSAGLLLPSQVDTILSQHLVENNDNDNNLGGVGSGEEGNNKSKEEIIAELEKKLQDYQRQLEMILSNPDVGMTDLATSLARFFETYGQYMQASNVFDMSKADSWLASNTLYNDCVELINNRLQQTYARENWLYQQEYNLPANAIARLIEAGINPAFYFGSLDKSNAGAIETPSLQSSQQPTAITGEVPWMQKLNGALGVVGALGQIGGLFNEGIGSISGATLNMSQALLNQFMTENGQRMQPYQIANLESVTAMNNALTKTEDETRSGKVATNWARVLEVENNAWYQKQQIKVQKKQLKNALKIARLTNDTNLQIADINSATQKYLAQIQKEMMQQRMIADGYLQILPYMEDYNVDEEYWDKETGESFSRDDMLNSTFKVQGSGGTSVNVAFVGDAHAEGQISNEDFEGWKENTTKTIGGRQYTKRQVSRRIFNPARWNQALEYVDKAYKDLKKGKITAEQFHYAKGSAYRIIQEEQDNANKYCIDKGLQEMFHGYLPSMDYMK